MSPMKNESLPAELLNAIGGTRDTLLQLLEKQSQLVDLVREQLRVVKVKASIKTVSVALTAQRISPDPLLVRWVVFTALEGNSGNVAIGDGSVNATSGTERGIVLAPLGMSPVMENIDLHELSLIGPAIADGVSYVYAI